MTETDSIRIDKYLWSVRIFKTRSMASEACRKGRVIVSNIQVKPSKPVVRDEIIIVRKPPVNYTFRVLEPVGNRLGAKLVSRYIEDLTPEEEKMKLELKNSDGKIFREKGTGRPTKKERRLIDRLREGPDPS